MTVKEEIFTLVNERVGAVICLHDAASPNSSQVLEAINHLVAGTLEERILKTKNRSLIKEDASHFFFSMNFGQQLNIIYSQLPKEPSKSELNQFISILDKQYNIETECEVVIIKPNGNTFKFHHPSLQVHHFEY